MRADSLKPEIVCKSCGYRLDELVTERCPECGREFDRNDSRTYTVQVDDTRVHWLATRNLFLVLLGAFLLMNIIGGLVVLLGG